MIKEVFPSKTGKKSFKLIQQEIDFYRKTTAPPPDLTFEERHLERMELRGARATFARNCFTCGVALNAAFDKVYAPKIGCEKCYHENLDLLK